uniref:Ventricular zone expressed PH domain containing 1 n=1 Tax=Monodon monoceros TaxID=40151 RepID=A0A8C6AJR3_MONMO
MHQLFRLVLGQKDLSRAGDLFSLDDSEIEDSLTEALEQIKIISSSSDYQTNNNDQAVVEICITRITTAIRETESIEKHAKALVGLWDSCLEHNLRPSGKDEDTPHAKIASDIMSCILQNYNRPPVMALAIPIAVKFLHRGNKELCRNMSNYLSLAAITKADLLADHTEVIVKSILQGAAQMGPRSQGNHSIGDQSVFLSTHHKHDGLIAEVQLDLIWIPLCAIGKQDSFV